MRYFEIGASVILLIIGFLIRCVLLPFICGAAGFALGFRSKSLTVKVFFLLSACGAMILIDPVAPTLVGNGMQLAFSSDNPVVADLLKLEDGRVGSSNFDSGMHAPLNRLNQGWYTNLTLIFVPVGYMTAMLIAGRRWRSGVLGDGKQKEAVVPAKGMSYDTPPPIPEFLKEADSSAHDDERFRPRFE